VQATAGRRAHVAASGGDQAATAPSARSAPFPHGNSSCLSGASDFARARLRVLHQRGVVDVAHDEPDYFDLAIRAYNRGSRGTTCGGGPGRSSARSGCG
jgi:hypothetical protein